MGDLRFRRALDRLRSAEDPAREIRRLSDGDLIGALAATSPRGEDARWVNVLATEALNRARRAKLIVDHIAEGVLILDGEGRVTFVNASAARLLNGRPSQFVGRLERDVLTLVDDRGKPVAPESLPHAKASRTRATVEHDSWCLSRPDGARIPVLIVAVPIPDSGDAEGTILTLRDVTHRRAAEEALRASEERYRLLAESATDIVSRATADGILEYVSPACRTVLGYEPDEMVGRSFADFAHPEDVAASKNRPPTSPTWTTTLRVRRSNGSWIWLETRARMLHHSDGGVLEIVAISRDLTERIQTERRLRDRERHLDDAQLLARVGSWEWDVDRDEFLPSPALQRLAGLHESDRILAIGDVLRLIPEPDRAEVMRVTQEALLHPGPYQYEHRLVRGDGSLRHFQCRGEVLDDQEGRARRVIGTAVDVTELKVAEARLRESERRYRFLAEHARDLVLSTNPSGRIVYASPASRALLGFEPEELLGQSALAFVAPEDRGRLLSLPPADRIGRDGGWRAEVRLLCKDGGRVWTEGVAQPVWDAGGRLTQVVCVVRDIGAWRKSLEEGARKIETLQARVAELEAALQDARVHGDSASGGAQRAT